MEQLIEALANVYNDYASKDPIECVHYKAMLDDIASIINANGGNVTTPE